MAINKKSIGSDVYRFFNGKTAETFNSDNDYQAGRISDIVLGKARITWKASEFGQKDTIEFISVNLIERHNSGDLVIVDNVPILDDADIQTICDELNEMDMSLKSGESDNPLLDAALAYQAQRKAEIPPVTDNQTESDKADNVVNLDKPANKRNRRNAS